VDRLARLPAEAYRRLTVQVRPLPGERDLLAALTAGGQRWAIATSGRMETAAWNLHALGVDPDKVPVVTRDQVKYAKPDPDLFVAAAARLDAPIETAVIIGDAIWDMLTARRCRLRCRPALWRLRPGGAGASRRCPRLRRPRRSAQASR
jgi:HAD superfamily hydrolase (TIGR01509 family)